MPRAGEVTVRAGERDNDASKSIASRLTLDNIGFLLAKASQRWNELLYERFVAAGFPEVRPAYGSLLMECPRFGGHLSAWSALSGWAGRMRHHAKGIELSQAVPAGVPA